MPLSPLKEVTEFTYAVASLTVERHHGMGCVTHDDDTVLVVIRGTLQAKVDQAMTYVLKVNQAMTEVV